MITYYDVCSECGSDHITFTQRKDSDSILDFVCRRCGVAWSDYAEDIYEETT